MLCLLIWQRERCGLIRIIIGIPLEEAIAKVAGKKTLITTTTEETNNFLIESDREIQRRRKEELRAQQKNNIMINP